MANGKVIHRKCIRTKLPKVSRSKTTEGPDLGVQSADLQDHQLNCQERKGKSQTANSEHLPLQDKKPEESDRQRHGSGGHISSTRTNADEKSVQLQVHPNFTIAHHAQRAEKDFL